MTFKLVGHQSTEISGQLLTKKRAKQQTDSSDNTSTEKVTLPSGHDLPVTKKRTKQQADPSDTTAKAMACHAKGQLGILSAPELKCYFSTKTANYVAKKMTLFNASFLFYLNKYFGLLIPEEDKRTHHIR